jgi:hypothetical protein
MQKKKKGILIMSLNSQRLQDAINTRSSFHFNQEVDELDVYVFDVFEVLNGIFFGESNAWQQKKIVEKTIEKLETGFVVTDTIKGELIRCSNRRKELNTYIQAVYSEYYTNPTFESHCRNQVFQNLQPKLKKLAVENNKSVLLELIMPFLIMEIALYLHIHDKNDYFKIYGMEKEMNIITAIKNNKYPGFNQFLKGNIEYITISAE